MTKKTKYTENISFTADSAMDAMKDAWISAARMYGSKRGGFPDHRFEELRWGENTFDENGVEIGKFGKPVVFMDDELFKFTGLSRKIAIRHFGNCKHLEEFDELWRDVQERRTAERMKLGLD